MKLTIGIVIAVALAISPQSTGAADDSSAEELSRKERCRRNPLDQWCVIFAPTVSFSLSGNSNFAFGTGFSLGTFVVKNLGLAGDFSYVRSSREVLFTGPATAEVVRETGNTYGTGLSLRYHLQFSDAFTLVPGYRGGLFWVRGQRINGSGTSHGPSMSLLIPFGERAWGGLTGTYEFSRFEGNNDRQFQISPSISVFF